MPILINDCPDKWDYPRNPNDIENPAKLEADVFDIRGLWADQHVTGSTLRLSQSPILPGPG